MVNLADRPALHGARPEDPVLTAPPTIAATAPDAIAAAAAPDFVASAPDLPDLFAPAKLRRGLSASSRRHPGHRGRRRAARADRAGDGAVRALARHRRSDRACAGPAHARALGGVYWFGTDMLGPRHLFPRPLRRAGVAARSASRSQSWPRWSGFDRPRLRLRALGRRHRDAGDGRADVDPADPARHRPDGAHPRQRRQRNPRHHHRGNSPRVAPGARRRAVAARAALCGRRGRGRHPHADDHPAPHPAQHARADDGAGDLCLRAAP